MTDKRCRKFQTCNSPLCPLDPQSTESGIWYPDEEICLLRAYGKLLWVRSQRKVAKVKAEGYFTLEMLQQNCIIKKGLEGLDPDSTEDKELQLEKWIKKHPAKRILSQAEKNRIVERLAGKKPA